MKQIKQIVVFKATPEEVYDAVVDAKKHSKFSQSKATNNAKVGGKFTAYDNYISGENLKLEKGKKIVQKWTSTDFPKGHYTEVVFEFKKQGDGTKLIFTQNNVPDENYADIKKGWIEFYWKPMKVTFGW